MSKQPLSGGLVRRIGLVVAAVAVAAGIGTFSAVANADTSRGCSNWQYKFTSKTLVDGTGNDRSFWAYQGYHFNVTDQWMTPAGDFHGTAYDEDKHYLGGGWVNKHDANLDYVTCW